jgi:hypothetical protein
MDGRPASIRAPAFRRLQADQMIGQRLPVDELEHEEPRIGCVLESVASVRAQHGDRVEP